MACYNPQLLAYWLAYGGSWPPPYPEIIALAVSDGDDPVDAMHRWYQRACALGANPPLPPKLTIDQSNDLRQYAAESNCTMSTLFDAIIDALLKGGSPTAAEAYKAHRSNNTPPVKATFNVYTKDQVIHNVPADKLEQMGPETLASVVAITDEIPWTPARLATFKKKQAEAIAEREAKKKAEFECAKARAMDEGEDLWKALASPESARFFNIYTPEGMRTLRLDDLLNGEEDLHYGRIDEIIRSDQRVTWPREKVRRLNAKRAEKAAASKKAARKEQIDDLVSKLLKERNEL